MHLKAFYINQLFLGQHLRYFYFLSPINGVPSWLPWCCVNTSCTNVGSQMVSQDSLFNNSDKWPWVALLTLVVGS